MFGEGLDEGREEIGGFFGVDVAAGADGCLDAIDAEGGAFLGELGGWEVFEEFGEDGAGAFRLCGRGGEGEGGGGGGGGGEGEGSALEEIAAVHDGGDGTAGGWWAQGERRWWG